MPVDDGKADNGDGPDHAHRPRRCANGTYQPLSRPLFIYVARKAADRPEVQKFVDVVSSAAPTLMREVGYVELTPQIYELARKHFAERKVGHGVRRRRIAGRADARSSCSPRAMTRGMSTCSGSSS